MAQFGTVDTVEGLLGNTKSNPKRIRSRSWFFTWNNANSSDVAQLISIFGDIEVEYVFQLEKVDTEHLQGCIRYKNPVGINFQKDLSSKIHWERCRSWRSAKKYCSKVNSRIDGPWTNVPGMKWRKTLKDPLRGKDLYPFQKDILALIKEEPDDRKIYWYWDAKGNSGKSALCKHIKMTYGDKVITVAGKGKDIFYAIASRLEDAVVDIDIVLIDVPRSHIDYLNYGGIEKLKDGYFFSAKYESKEVIINSPHIVIFANREPSRDSMSIDRWVIKNITTLVHK